MMMGVSLLVLFVVVVALALEVLMQGEHADNSERIDFELNKLVSLMVVMSLVKVVKVAWSLKVVVVVVERAGRCEGLYIDSILP